MSVFFKWLTFGVICTLTALKYNVRRTEWLKRLNFRLYKSYMKTNRKVKPGNGIGKIRLDKNRSYRPWSAPSLWIKISKRSVWTALSWSVIIRPKGLRINCKSLFFRPFSSIPDDFTKTYLVKIVGRDHFARTCLKCTLVDYEWKRSLTCLRKAYGSLINGGSQGKSVKENVSFSHLISMQKHAYSALYFGVIDSSIVNTSDVVVLPNVSSKLKLRLSL